ncbi:aldo/keto reductase [Reticulomyxa filosa]|uniref:Aldo/keto reductase n=1 Tax=Reticulomyxa filosa TaxID=46433 RepID=X6N1C9_RETFI|nr:aldo/keto reductase [Reticulomyxa filosa]|eukprot:ETO20075.1 aldo/keto reductase [Reticulomyxa filosa]
MAMQHTRSKNKESTTIYQTRSKYSANIDSKLDYSSKKKKDVKKKNVNDQERILYVMSSQKKKETWQRMQKNKYFQFCFLKAVKEVDQTYKAVKKTKKNKQNKAKSKSNKKQWNKKASKQK